MADRWRAPGGWTVEVVRLSGTPDNRNGEWLRVRQYGYHTADVRSVAELAQWFDLAGLEPDEGGLAHGRRVVPRLVPRAPAARPAALNNPVPAATRLRGPGRIALARHPADVGVRV